MLKNKCIQGYEMNEIIHYALILQLQRPTVFHLVEEDGSPEDKRQIMLSE